MLTAAERQRDSRSMEGVVFVGHNLDPIVGRVFAFFRAPVTVDRDGFRASPRRFEFGLLFLATALRQRALRQNSISRFSL